MSDKFTEAEEDVMGKLMMSAETGNAVIIHWPKNCDKSRLMHEVTRRLDELK